MQITSEKVDMSSLKTQQEDPFVILLDNVFSDEYCQNLIDISETTGNGFEYIYKNGVEKDPSDIYRSNKRNLIFNKELTDEIYLKIKSYLPKTFNGNNIIGMNSRLSCLKYLPGEHFIAHYDGPFMDPETKNTTCITVQIYLNDTNGGTTRFYDEYDETIFIDILPKCGQVLIFEHDLKHSGMPVYSGMKYCIRGDILYETNESSRDEYDIIHMNYDKLLTFNEFGEPDYSKLRKAMKRFDEMKK